MSNTRASKAFTRHLNIMHERIGNAEEWEDWLPFVEAAVREFKFLIRGPGTLCEEDTHRVRWLAQFVFAAKQATAGSPLVLHKCCNEGLCEGIADTVIAAERHSESRVATRRTPPVADTEF